MNTDLKLIKNKFGEDMMHLCRRLFPTILEYDGLLFKLMSENFDYSKELYNDIIDNKMADEFKNYIMCKAKLNMEYKDNDYYKTPFELLDEAGYNLYECKSEEEIDSFIKYYKEGERLCTFGEDRLEDAYVFFAVKKDVDDIKREDFDSPARQDRYGTSVISIQFSRGDVNTLKIMNRYNHAVDKADATFSNNLDNIIPGLTRLFEKYYGFNIHSNTDGFDIPNYVTTMDGKYYKYNFAKKGIYYCPNNVIIDSKYVAHKYDKEKYIIVDDYIIDLVNKEVRLFDTNIKDSFLDGFNNIKNIKVLNDKSNNMKKIIMDDEIILEINKDNRLINYYNPNIRYLDNSFINYKNNCLIEKLDLPNVIEVGEDFFEDNKELKELRLENVKSIEDGFLRVNRDLEYLYMPNVMYIGNYGLSHNKKLESINLPNLVEVGEEFLNNNNNLKKVSFDKLRIVGSKFLENNNTITDIYLPSAEIIKSYFMRYNNSLNRVVLPNVKNIDNNFLYSNEVLKELYIPSVINIGDNFMKYNNSIDEIDLPNVVNIGNNFLLNNNKIKSINFPSVVNIGYNFMDSNFEIESVFMPNVENVLRFFIKNATFLKALYMPKLSDKSIEFLGDNIKENLNNNKSKIKSLIMKHF